MVLVQAYIVLTFTRTNISVHPAWSSFVPIVASRQFSLDPSLTVFEYTFLFLISKVQSNCKHCE